MWPFALHADWQTLFKVVCEPVNRSGQGLPEGGQDGPNETGQGWEKESLTPNVTRLAQNTTRSSVA